MELFTHCRRCHTEHVGGDLYTTEYVQWHASAPDQHLPGQISARGYCEACKDAYYRHNRERIRLAYQLYLDSFPTPGYIYGLLQEGQVCYIGRTHDVDRRIVEHRRTGKMFDGRRILATVTPGYLLAEMEARWLSHGLQQGWPLTNKEEAFPSELIQWEAGRNYFTCSVQEFQCGDKVTIHRVRCYEQWVQDMPSELPTRRALWSDGVMYPHSH
jgi:predicted GIY-YIG superfamily endonuclease